LEQNRKEEQMSVNSLSRDASTQYHFTPAKTRTIPPASVSQVFTDLSTTEVRSAIGQD